MRSVGMPVAWLACCLTSSSSSRVIIRLSTTTKAIRVCPSSKINARDIKRSWARSAVRSRKPPELMTGKVVGVMSTWAAPARKVFPSAAEGLVARAAIQAAMKKRGKVFMDRASVGILELKVLAS